MMDEKKSSQNGWSLKVIGLLVALVSMSGSSAAWAAGGVLEINQTCAEATGCFEGDTPGFPVTIPAEAAGGSFILTSNLLVPRAAFGGISVAREAADVSLDLNGFEIRSPWCIETLAEPCDPPAYELNKDGVSQASSLAGLGTGLAVKNGQVIGFSGVGVRTGEAGFVENVGVRANGGEGIFVFDGSIVVSSQSAGNGRSGIFVCCSGSGGNGSLVLGGLTEINRADGINASSSVLIAETIHRTNFSRGVRTSAPSLLVENSAFDNREGGFDGSGISLYLRNSAHLNLLVGFRAAPSGGANLVANSVSANGGPALSIASETTGYRNNILSPPDSGSNIAISGGTSTGENLCTPFYAPCP